MIFSPSVAAALDANATRLQLAAARALAPTLEPEICAWAESNFRLSSEDSAAPGLIVLEEWQREILQAWQRGKITVVGASSQVGKTAIGLIIAAFSVRFRQGPTRYVHENDGAALRFSSERITPMIKANLEDMRTKAKSGRGSQIARKFSNGSSLTIVGANTPTGLSSSPVKTLIATEVRGFPVSAGTGVRKSGDPLGLALARGKSFPDFKAYIESSPGIKGACRLTEALEAGDFRKWAVPCPHCGHVAPIEYEPEAGAHSVWFERNKPETAGIACAECGSIWTAAERLDALRKGTFVATKAASDPDYASFQFAELESVRSNLADIVRRMEAAKVSTERQQQAVNTILGRAFDIEEHGGIEIADEALEAHRQRYNAEKMLPPEVLVITAGIDTQPDRLEVQVLGHGVGKNRWSLEYKVFEGNPNGESVWEELSNFLLNTRYKHPLGGTLKIKAACIDSGGANTQAVYAFCANNLSRGRQWYAIKGIPGHKHLAKRSAHTALRQGSEHKLYTLGVDALKSVIFDALQSDSKEGRIYFPEHYEAAFFDGLNAEKKVITTDRKGQQVIAFRKAKNKARNEPLDTLAYGLAAFELLTPKPDFKSIRESLTVAEDKTDFGDLSNVLALVNGKSTSTNNGNYR